MNTTRTRVMDGRTITGAIYNWHDGNRLPPNSGSSTWGNGNFTGTYRTSLDNVNLAFARRKAQGEIIMSDCKLTSWTRTMTPGSLSAHNHVVPDDFDGTIVGDMVGSSSGLQLNPDPMPIASSNEDVLLMRAYANINKAPVMGGESVSDLGQTISMLKRPFKSASDLLLTIARGKMRHLERSGGSVARASANAWLEYRYGWKPIILDMQTIIKEAHKKREKCDQLRLVSRAGDMQESTDSINWSAQSGGGTTGGRTSYKRTKCDVGVMYDYKSRTSTEELQRILGFRARDVPATLWELVPYSFVVDWFVNVGEWLQAITPDPNVTFRGHWATHVQEVTVDSWDSWVYVGTLPVHVTVWQGSLGSEKVKTRIYQRICNQPMLFTPTWKGKNLSRLHQIDALALIMKPLLGQFQGLRH